MSEIAEVEVIFLLLLFFVVVFGLLARRLGIMPYPIVMVVGGLLLAGTAKRPLGRPGLRDLPPAMGRIR
jgi:hypothetical protein